LVQLAVGVAMMVSRDPVRVRLEKSSVLSHSLPVRVLEFTLATRVRMESAALLTGAAVLAGRQPSPVIQAALVETLARLDRLAVVLAAAPLRL
jgi:hypothetical protein